MPNVSPACRFRGMSPPYSEMMPPPRSEKYPPPDSEMMPPPAGWCLE